MSAAHDFRDCWAVELRRKDAATQPAFMYGVDGDGGCGDGGGSGVAEWSLEAVASRVRAKKRERERDGAS